MTIVKIVRQEAGMVYRTRAAASLPLLTVVVSVSSYQVSSWGCRGVRRIGSSRPGLPSALGPGSPLFASCHLRRSSTVPLGRPGRAPAPLAVGSETVRLTCMTYRKTVIFRPSSHCTLTYQECVDVVMFEAQGSRLAFYFCSVSLYVRMDAYSVARTIADRISPGIRPYCSGPPTGSQADHDAECMVRRQCDRALLPVRVTSVPGMTELSCRLWESDDTAFFAVNDAVILRVMNTSLHHASFRFQAATHVMQGPLLSGQSRSLHRVGFRFFPPIRMETNSVQQEVADAPQDESTKPVDPARLPLKVLRIDEVSASIFERIKQINGDLVAFHNVSFSRSYRDDKNNRQYTKSFSSGDLGKLVELAKQATEFIDTRKARATKA